jgi:hypothetical protein
VFVTELEGGTLTSSAAGCAWCLVRPLGVWNGIVDSPVVVGTLLGPEGTGNCFFLEGFMLVVPPGVTGVWRWGMWGDFPYFENCTVDASI